MPVSPETRERTRAYARVIGPFLVIVPGIIAIRAGEMGNFLASFFASPALVWITGGLLLFAGLVIIARHQVWSGPAAILISLFGWFLAFRGAVLVWLRLDGGGRVARCHLRDASWFQWPLLETAIEGNIVADFPLCNKSFNCSYSGHDL